MLILIRTFSAVSFSSPRQAPPLEPEIRLESSDDLVCADITQKQRVRGNTRTGDKMNTHKNEASRAPPETSPKRDLALPLLSDGAPLQPDGIDPDREQCFPLSRAARQLPSIRGKKPPHPMTLYRWATRGLKARSGQRIWLETIFIGRTRVTSKEALVRFFDRINDVDYHEVTSSQHKVAELRKRAERAKMFLKRMNMLR